MLKTYRNIILEEANYGGLPVAYWPLDEVAGTTAAADLMTLAQGTGYPATIAGGVTLDSAGPISGETSLGYAYDGVNGRAYTANTTSGAGWSGVTIEAWIKRNGAQPDSGFGTLLNKTRTSGSGQPSFAVFPKTTGCRMRVNTSSSDSSFNLWEISTDLTSGIWVHLAWACAANSILCYVNGASQTVTPGNSAAWTTGTIVADNTPFLIGASNTAGSSLRLKGSVAHLAVYSYQLAAARIKAHYLAGINGCNGLRMAA